MAQLISGLSRCVVCQRVLEPGDRVFATSGCAFDPSDRLFRYCDAGIHWDCYVCWPDRPRFAAGYVNSAVRFEREDPVWGAVHLDDFVFLCVRPEGVRIHFFATSQSVQMPLRDWPCDPPQDRLHELEWHDWLKSRVALYRQYPGPEDLLARVDWDAKAELGRRQTREKEERRLAERQQLDSYNERMHSLQGAPCPRCGAFTLRYLDRRAAGGKSCFICQVCGRSAHWQDFPREDTGGLFRS
jgi:hypothetical protein